MSLCEHHFHLATICQRGIFLDTKTFKKIELTLLIGEIRLTCRTNVTKIQEIKSTSYLKHFKKSPIFRADVIDIIQ